MYLGMELRILYDSAALIMLIQRDLDLEYRILYDSVGLKGLSHEN